MKLFHGRERDLAIAISALAHSNPFLPERTGLEREILGEARIAEGFVWSVRTGAGVQNPNVPKLASRAAELVESVRPRLAAVAGSLDSDERALYEDVSLYVLHSRYEDRFWELVVEPARAVRRVPFWTSFEEDFRALLGATGPERGDAPEVFALLFQIRRAFHHIFRDIVGASMPAARLRGEAWRSIFTHDMRRYRRVLRDRMGDFTTLVTGPSGTGKELVARAIALSRHVPFEPKTAAFTADVTRSFHALNLPAFSPTLIESELFGHHRGAFTGAVEDRQGWLEVCLPLGTIFLDEIGELDPGLQVKLLRVLQERTFHRIGETRERRFGGKLIAATNRDLGAEMRAGRFREDLYYRLCADRIHTPSLAEQLVDEPGDLGNLLHFIASRILPEGEAETLAGEVAGWIDRRLGRDYPWPGNFRELEQCVRNVLVRGEYLPAETEDPLAQRIDEGGLSADELVSVYCRKVYRTTGSYSETARRLGLDRRTVRRRVAGGEKRDL